MAASLTNDMSVYSLVVGASVPVQVVMGILLILSLVSWWFIFMKSSEVRRANRRAKEFEKAFWSGVDINKIYQGLSSNKEKGSTEGMAVIFEAGFQEFARNKQHAGATAAETMEGTRRAMRAAYNREMDYLDASLPFLASVGSVSPYIGLFGTVWGIMNAFMGLSTTAQATLAQVAPGIAEALIATAIGLFAAIPAVIAYNRFIAKVDHLSVRYESFIEEFSNILQRRS
jgi:biopolymer transport protein TolQ